MGLVRLQGLVCRSTRSYRVPCGAAPRAVSDSDHRFLDRPSAVSFETVSYPRAVPPLRSFCVDPFAPSFRWGLSCRGLAPLRGITEGVHSTREFPGSRYVPSSGFLCLSTASSTFGFAGLFHPAATSRIPSPFRGFSRSAAVPTRRRAMPPCRWPPPAHRQAGCHGRTPRLRGFTLRTDAFLGAAVNRPVGRSPLRLHSSSRH